MPFNVFAIRCIIFTGQGVIYFWLGCLEFCDSSKQEPSPQLSHHYPHVEEGRLLITSCTFMLWVYLSMCIMKVNYSQLAVYHADVHIQLSAHAKSDAQHKYVLLRVPYTIALYWEQPG